MRAVRRGREVVVAATNKYLKKSAASSTSSLQALTKAALLLPGLLSTPVQATEGD